MSKNYRNEYLYGDDDDDNDEMLLKKELIRKRKDAPDEKHRDKKDTKRTSSEYNQ